MATFINIFNMIHNISHINITIIIIIFIIIFIKEYFHISERKK